MHIKTVYCGFATKVVMSGLVIVFAAGTATLGQQSPTPVATPAFKAEDPLNRSLDATLYMQTAAEYRASCFQAYNLASARLDELIKGGAGKFAVVMDLDETVFNNSRFQAMLLKNGLAWDKDLWAEWERDYSKDVTLIPGAKEFIEKATRSPGVEVFFVSNRNGKEYKQQAQDALTRLGIPLKDEKHLKLADPTAEGSSNKTERFQKVKDECNCEVLLYVGDNLRDFNNDLRFAKLPEKPSAEDLDRAIAERKDAVDKVRGNFGQTWVILPNPTYGEWKVPLGRGQSDFDRLDAATFQISPEAKCNMIWGIPVLLLLLCIIWTLRHWPDATDLSDKDESRKKFQEFLVGDVRANSQYCYWYLALIGVIATIVTVNKSYFQPILNQEHLWPFGLSFLAASLALLFVPADYGLQGTRNLRFVWLRSVLCEQIVVIFTCYGIWEAFRVMTSTVH
jgi:5'-nucleotidase (lipoprotein e(P4) family)